MNSHPQQQVLSITPEDKFFTLGITEIFKGADPD
jgi:hypothetical protein